MGTVTAFFSSLPKWRRTALRPSVYLFTQVQVDGPDWPAGLLVLVVLQDVRLAAQPTAPQHEPTPLPRLEGNRDYHPTVTLSKHICLI